MLVRNLVPAVAVVSCLWLPARPAVAADSYKADPAHSSVVFRVKHMQTSYAWGRFNEISGSFAIDDAEPTQSRFEFEVKSASVDTANTRRDQHLKSPDFLSAVQYPTISFKSKSVSSVGKETFEVSGDLTLHGVTRPVTLKLTRTGTGQGPTGQPIAGIETGFFVKRSEFGMNKMVGPVADEIWVNVSVEGIKQ
jgi:polyisoprenoid-binding protein YceI